MKDTTTQKGFTLVELAIVMTIIGLLIGGILKGQELMQNARITATIAQIRAIEAATTTFRDKYEAMPGDMQNARTRLPNCAVATCDPFVAAAPGAPGAGDGMVGAPTWVAAANSPAPNNVANQTQILAAGAATTAVGDETELFWLHLLKADLLSGVTDAFMDGSPNGLASGETNPAAKSGNAVLVAGYGNGVGLPGSGAGAGVNTGPTGLIIVLAPTAAVGQNAMASGNNTIGTMPLLPTRAAQIDRKMDDGAPGKGYVQAYGGDLGAAAGSSCYNQVAPFSAASPGYLESTTTPDCGLVFRIQG